MLRIAVFADSDEDLEMYWLTGLTRGDDGGWQVRAVTRGLRTGAMKQWHLPIGFLPVLALGRYYVNGEMLQTQVRGITKSFVIPNVALGREVGSEIIPPELYSFAGHRRGVQRLFSYRIGQTIVLVPAIELVRALFLHNKTLAHTLMHSGGLLELFRPEEVGFHSALHLRFTPQMPIGNLSKEFVGEFAWLAVHPDGRRSWDSVYEKTCGHRYVSFCPPPLLDSAWTFRGVHVKDVWLVLELQQITGKHYPCDKLLYSHPSLRQSVIARHGDRRSLLRGNDSATSAVVSEFVVDVTKGSKQDVHQRAVGALARGGGFEQKIEIERVWSDDSVRYQGGVEGKSRRHVGNPVAIQHRETHASMEEPAVGWGALPPIEFRLLERAGWNLLGKLEPLANVIETMAALLPDVEISMSLCLLKRGRSFSWVKQERRACLVAVFRPASGVPVVLLDVDHAGQRALSTLMLRYRQAVAVSQIEKHIQVLLDRLVERGGHWDDPAEKGFAEIFACERLRKVLRQEGRKNDAIYLNIWANRLICSVDLVCRIY